MTVELSSCPICGLKARKRKFRPLYDVLVCKKCRNRFANRRQLACILDGILFSIATGILLGFLSSRNRNVHDFAFSLIPSVLYMFKDGFGGKSIGRYLFGVQVIDRTTREPIGYGQSFKRNLMFFPLGLFGSIGYFLQFIFILVVSSTMLKGRRWGDRWANTEVIWLKYRNRVPFEPRPNICRRCGYDLTGNVSGRCPECGQVIPDSARAMIAINSGQSSPKTVD